MIKLKTMNHKFLHSFRKWTDLANWAEKNLSPGEYYAVTLPIANLFSIRKVVIYAHEGKPAGVWVERRGNI